MHCNTKKTGPSQTQLEGSRGLKMSRVCDLLERKRRTETVIGMNVPQGRS